MNVKIAAFVYDFPHSKSADNLLRLKLEGFDQIKCFAAPKKQLNINNSKIRVIPKEVSVNSNPKDIAKLCGYDYQVIPHEQIKKEDLLDFDFGLILGARILPQHLTNTLPIINAHPGVLPENRGLDNLKHAILQNLPQGITFHIIDHRIDRGTYLIKRLISVDEDDELQDIYMKLRKAETSNLIEAIKTFLEHGYSLGEIKKGTYFKPLTPSQELRMLQIFPYYKENYDQIIERYLVK